MFPKHATFYRTLIKLQRLIRTEEKEEKEMRFEKILHTEFILPNSSDNYLREFS